MNVHSACSSQFPPVCACVCLCVPVAVSGTDAHRSSVFVVSATLEKFTPGCQSNDTLTDFTQCSRATIRQSLIRCGSASSLSRCSRSDNSTPTCGCIISKSTSDIDAGRPAWARSACASSSTTGRWIMSTSTSELEDVRVGGSLWHVRGVRQADKRWARASARTSSCEELQTLICRCGDPESAHPSWERNNRLQRIHINLSKLSG